MADQVEVYLNKLAKHEYGSTNLIIYTTSTKSLTLSQTNLKLSSKGNPAKRLLKIRKLVAQYKGLIPPLKPKHSKKPKPNSIKPILDEENLMVIND